MEERVIEYIKSSEAKLKKLFIRELICNAIEIIILVVAVLNTIDTKMLIPVVIIGGLIIFAVSLINIIVLFGNFKSLSDTINNINRFTSAKQELDKNGNKSEYNKVISEIYEKI